MSANKKQNTDAISGINDAMSTSKKQNTDAISDDMSSKLRLTQCQGRIMNEHTEAQGSLKTREK